MSDVVKRASSAAHLAQGGVGFHISGAAFSNPSDKVNLATTPSANYDVTPEPGSNRNSVRLLPEGLFLVATGTINALAPGNTIMLTVPAGLNFQLKSMTLRAPIGTSGDISSPASASVGVSGSFDDVYPLQILMGLTAAGRVFRFPQSSGVIVTAAQNLRLVIGVAAVGTTLTLDWEAYGRFFL